MKVSIAMTTYNGASYLEQQLDSFLCQERLPDQLVVCDDGSVDNTIKILEEFAERAPFQVFIGINDVNLGYVKNFEKAISLCDGDIIFFSDQDDVWLKNKISDVCAQFHDNPAMVAITNDQWITDENLTPTKYTKLWNTRRLGLPDGWFVTGCCSAITKTWVNVALPIPDFIPGHDVWINRLADFMNVRLIHDVPLQYYRRHEKNTSSADTSSKSGVSKFRLFLRYGFAPADEGWEKRVKDLDAYKKRIEERIDLLKEIVDDGSIDKALCHIELNSFNLKTRIKIVKKPLLIRFFYICYWYKKGLYSYFSGIKSAIKDAVRR